MFQPEGYALVLLFMVLSMLCWGSWVNTIKLCPGYRFQLFYWDYTIGMVVGVLLFGFTMGSHGASGLPFVADIVHAHARPIGLALAGGVIFNVANLLLVAAIDLAGLAVAVPVGIGIALVVGAAGSYVVAPAGNPFLLFGGIAVVVAAIVVDARAYRMREQKKSVTTRSVVICVVAGVLMGIFYPFVASAMAGKTSTGPYATAFYFTIGVVISSLVANTVLMRKPMDGRDSVAFNGYARAPLAWHAWGILGGIVWMAGGILNFTSAQAHLVGPAVSYSIGQGSTMVSAAWGVWVWHEFADAPRRAKVLLAWMFALFICGLAAVALAPVL